MKTSVDQDTCISCGVCVSMCPDVYQFNDDEKSEPIVEEIPEELQDDAITARDSCPVDAIDIEE
ncbi:ferredoxin [[Clostridium] polysaccharolyticum]|uniref:Ferredoxin n=1 Tax=[Clostridium] polysaccharolyticum TaxID=29364 RepID=A0A1H9ZV77_9FIRM|nr:ferredoxin [[Clostridium] polysaccharolyticum]SES85668.1 ferredoxin [[Clostridium] polysaccharolyticum]